MNIPKDVNYIIKKLNDAGHEAFVVGGCVRDYLLGKNPMDFDIATDASPHVVKEIFNYTFDTGIKHGTITVVLNKRNYEITTYRIDGEYKNFRQPEEVIFTDNIYLDLSRRDFTMNAIAYHHETGFVDPFNGGEDIKNKIIRGVGEPNTRFNEDALRMMRAVRFSAQLCFLIEEQTYNAIECNAHLIENISTERIRDEFLKIIVSDNPEKLKVLKTTGLLSYFLPEVLELLKDEKTTQLKNTKKDALIRLCILFEGLDKKSTSDILKRLKFDNKTIKSASILVDYANKKLSNDPYEIRALLSSIGGELFTDLIELKKALDTDKNYIDNLNNISKTFENIKSCGDCLTLKQLNINGNDIKELGLKNLTLTGEILNSLLHIVLREPDKNDRNFLLAEAEKHIAKRPPNHLQ